MTDRNRDHADSGEEIDVQVTPVDDEFSSLPSKPAPRRVAVAHRPPPRTVPPPRAVAAELPRPVATARSVPRLYFEAMVATLACCLFVVTFIAQPVSVETGSMLNAILGGDHLLVNRTVYGGPAWLGPLLPHREVRRGDVVVFRHPSRPHELYVKRVVGLPGETVEIYGTRVYVDGRELPETRALARETAPEGPIEVVGEPRVAEGATWTVYYSHLRDLGDGDELSALVSTDRGTVAVGRPFTVPPGQYFCLGDNRDNSEDSRFWGPVPRENVVGRAMLVYWSTDAAGGGFGRVRWSRIGTLVE
jgi:signal peptidase I